MSVWATIVCCWIGGSFPLAVLLGKVMAAQSREVAPDESSAEVDALLAEIFAA